MCLFPGTGASANVPRTHLCWACGREVQSLASLWSLPPWTPLTHQDTDDGQCSPSPTGRAWHPPWWNGSGELAHSLWFPPGGGPLASPVWGGAQALVLVPVCPSGSALASYNKVS